MLFGRRRPNERRRPLLNRVREFLQVLGDVPDVVEHFVNVFAVGTQCVVKLIGDGRGGDQRLVQLLDRVAQLGPVLREYRVEIGYCVVGFRLSLLEVIVQQFGLGAGAIQMLQR